MSPSSTAVKNTIQLQGLIVEDPTVTMKCKIAIQVQFLYFNLCLSVM